MPSSATLGAISPPGVGDDSRSAPDAASQLIRDAWKNGCDATMDGDMDAAITHFARAALLAYANRDPLETTARQAELLALRLREEARQREYHRQAHGAADRALQETRMQLEALLSEHAIAGVRPSLWGRILTAAGVRARVAEPVINLGYVRYDAAVAPPPIATPAQQVATQAGQLVLPLGIQPPDPTPTPMPTPEAPDMTSDISDSAPHEVLPAIQTQDTELKKRGLAVQVLGAFRVSIGDQLVERCASSRGRAVFTYLVTHRGQIVSRDVLMETFWPDADPAAARNSLNVALHSLRRSLMAAGGGHQPVVLFEHGQYSLNPGLALWVDVDEFLQHSDAGRKHEEAGNLSAAIDHYEQAVALYQGDFLADSPYEEWTVLPREKLRMAYLDVLDRVSRIYLSRGQYAACITLCQLILAQDNCREDAHCRLMHCYARQNQKHLALRQYQACVDALRKELNVPPAAATTELHERIRRHERV
jgi:DNA-binding SARP family transcriptional activator